MVVSIRPSDFIDDEEEMGCPNCEDTTKRTMNKNLNKAKCVKMDEFYTQLSDIEKEMKHYKEQFKGKVVFCNCDDPRESSFFKYFALHFNSLGLKKLITTHYAGTGKPAHKIELTAADLVNTNADGGFGLPDVDYILEHGNVLTLLDDDGDFRSPECVELLKEADIVVTNPPFSLFREFVDQLVRYKKQFLIIGSDNAITYRDMFKLIKENKIWPGYDKVKEFRRPDGSIQKFGNIGWFTNLDVPKRHETMDLYRTYAGHEQDYPHYDNYDAINVGKVVDIPKDWDGVMGVPITFLGKYNPEQFELLACMSMPLHNYMTYKRLLIKRVGEV